MKGGGGWVGASTSSSPQTCVWSLSVYQKLASSKNKAKQMGTYVNERKRLMIKALRNMKVWLCIGKIWLEGKKSGDISQAEKIYSGVRAGEKNRKLETVKGETRKGERDAVRNEHVHGG